MCDKKWHPNQQPAIANVGSVNLPKALHAGHKRELSRHHTRWQTHHRWQDPQPSHKPHPHAWTGSMYDSCKHTYHTNLNAFPGTLELGAHAASLFDIPNDGTTFFVKLMRSHRLSVVCSNISSIYCTVTFQFNMHCIVSYNTFKCVLVYFKKTCFFVCTCNVHVFKYYTSFPKIIPTFLQISCAYKYRYKSVWRVWTASVSY